MLHVGNLESRRDITDVRDTVRAYRAISSRMASRTAPTTCAGARPTGSARLLDILLGLARVLMEVRTDPARLRPSDTPIVLGSHARLTRETGWNPHIPIERTLADILETWRERAAA